MVTQRVGRGVVFTPYHFGGWYQGKDLLDKWNGVNTTPRATRRVTIAWILMRVPSGLSSQIHWPSRMPASLASAGLISANMFCCNSASHGFERLSSPPPSYSTRRPLV